MPKYYVHSGEIQSVVNAKTPIEAATIAFRNCLLSEDEKPTQLGLLVSVNEHGFGPIYNDDIMISTSTILQTLGLENDYITDEQALEQLLSDDELDEE